MLAAKQAKAAEQKLLDKLKEDKKVADAIAKDQLRNKKQVGYAVK